ncbi:mitochondrial intermembrane space import and assembly protein 40-B isoform X1 [Dermacentor andersoni]|uniref:mitochondrial intermembrane space import and assembly protein 40-B isoform X1 n=1 Tax=Dermacentor andersoni TaxID=34620 RepID=UPI0024164863|nr:mitochondrial intermembrane space import and assembly protein 40-B-like isoform X1 [Dermacentor andersoni]
MQGKDRVIFITKEDHEKPSTIQLPDDPDDEKRGLILPNGDINWNCPCLGGMATGPCGPQFREAFSCFHYSTSETKGSECFNHFKAMQECMSQYPTLYPADDDDDEQASHKANPGEEEVTGLGYALSKTSAVTENEPPKEDKRVASQ